VKIGDIVSLKYLFEWGECRIENIYGNKDDPMFEVRPLAGPGNSILLGLKTHDMRLVSKRASIVPSVSE
jgi:hypothetical protein